MQPMSLLKQGWLQFTLILLALSLLLSGKSHAAEMVPVRSITVTGFAKRHVVPDEAHLTVNLNSMDAKLAAAKTAHDAKLKKLMSIVDDAGIDEKKVRTQSSSVQPVYRYDHDPKTNRSKRTLEGYRAQTTVDITVGDTSKLGKLMDTVTAAGFEQGANAEWGDLTSSYYSLSNPERIRDEMLAEAIANAKDKANKMAAAAGANVSRVYQINESGAPSFDFPRPMMMRAAAPMMAMAKDAGGSAEMAPPAGEQEVNASVTVMFELKD